MSVTLKIWLPAFRPDRGTIARELIGVGEDVVVSTGKGFRNGSAVMRRGGSPGEGIRHSSAGAAGGMRRALGVAFKAIGLEFGHASIRLPDTFIGYWGPDDDLDEVDCVAMTEEDEANNIRRPPDHVIELPGLDVPAMEVVWERALATPYDLRNHNCCTVCFRAIEAGVEAMNRKKVERAGAFELMQHVGSGVFRMFTNPLTTFQAIESAIESELIFLWNPRDLLAYARFVRDVVIG